MDPPQIPSATAIKSNANEDAGISRSMSFSQSSDDSQTAADFIDSQLKLEADAREALPYRFDSCTKPLGNLRQLLFACLTCNPPPPTTSDSYNPAAVCYSCSVSCHGEHTLVELFNKRNFVCDCGTTRLPATSPCTLRINPLTNQKGGVVSEPAHPGNQYNHNFRNRFCGCECDYDAEKQEGTMFQCLGLGHAGDGGCGEDWWHAGCVVGLGPNWYEAQTSDTSGKGPIHEGALDDTGDGRAEDAGAGNEEDEVPLPPGFPEEDDFDGFICYKCVDANPWIKRYAGSRGFLDPVFKRSKAPSPETPEDHPADLAQTMDITSESVAQSELQIDSTETSSTSDTLAPSESLTRKRKADDEDDLATSSKRVRDSGAELERKTTDSAPEVSCRFEQLPPAPEGTLSLFFKSEFRDHLCRCSNCFPRMAKHAQLLEEEEAYEPPVSEEGEDGEGSTVGSGSLLDRGERALTNVDRVRAIEGVMAYNHLKEKLQPFFKEFAESGKAISAEDIKAHFAKMRGDEEAIKQAGEGAAKAGDHRREQSGY